jgi:sortase A
VTSNESPQIPRGALPEDIKSSGRLRRAADAAGRVLDSARRRTVPRRILKTASVLLLLAGIGLFSYPFATNMYADFKQGGLEKEFRSASLRQAYVTRTIRPGQALTRIVMPKLGVDSIVVEGTTPSALRAGAGHYEGTALPCERGNAGIAGHRTTYSKPFARVDELETGDRIILETPVGKCWYRVTGKPWVTSPYDWSIVRPMIGSFLTLTTCHPPGSASERLIVRARLIRTEYKKAS